MKKVIKIGGRAQADELIYPMIAAVWQSAPGKVCIVHGGGDEVTSLQRLMGREPAFVNGRRVTSEADIDLLRMTLSGVSNKRIVARLQESGARAVGVSGEDGMLIGAIQVADAQLGQVGTPREINAGLLDILLGAGYLPVISPMGRSLYDGAPLNVNGDDAAAAIAGALGADELLLVADVAGVLADGAVVPELTEESARALIERGAATGGMIAKLESALGALERGVRQVRVGGSEMLRDPRAGTTIRQTVSVA